MYILVMILLYYYLYNEPQNMPYKVTNRSWEESEQQMTNIKECEPACSHLKKKLKWILVKLKLNAHSEIHILNEL